MEKLYQELKSNSSSNKKQEILKSVTDANIKEALRLCYEPMTQFYIKKFEVEFDPTAKGTFKTTATEFFDLLKKLNTRVYTGNAARSAVETFLSKCKPDTQHIYSLILKKDLKIGVTETALNKAYGKEFIEEFKVQLADKYLPTKTYKGVEYWWATPKLDGIRSYSIFNSIRSRQGHEQAGFEHITEEANKILEMGFEFVDGELFTDAVDFESISGMVSRSKNINKDEKEKVYYNVFAIGSSKFKNTEDMVNAMNAIDWSQFKYLIQVKYVKIKNTPEEVIKWCKRFVREGYEGIMLRHPDKWYEWKRSGALLKYKLFKEDDFLCIGFNPGEKGTKYEHTLGTILVEGVDIIVDDDGKEIDRKPICSEVSGFTDEMRDKIWNDRKFYLNKTVEVKYQNSTGRIDKETGKYSLRFASFNKWKLDR